MFLAETLGIVLVWGSLAKTIFNFVEISIQIATRLVVPRSTNHSRACSDRRASNRRAWTRRISLEQVPADALSGAPSVTWDEMIEEIRRNPCTCERA